MLEEFAQHKTTCLVGRLTARAQIFSAWVNVRRLQQNNRVDIPTGVSIMLASIEQCLQATHNRSLQMSEQFVRYAFANEMMCHAAFVHDKMVSYAWRSEHSAPHTEELDVAIAPGYSYGFKALTLAEFRGKGIYPAIAEMEQRECLARGLHHGISFTETHNRSAIIADRKFGNTIVGLAGYIGTKNRPQCFRSKSVAQLGFGFVDTDKDSQRLSTN